MFNFQVNHEEAFEGNDLIPEGNWEVVVKEAKESETQSGRKNISIQLAVRNDLSQKYKNKIIFDTIWTKKDDNETYNMGNLQTVAKALDIPNGKSYNSLQELLRDWLGKGAKVYVQHETYQEKTNARVKGWAKTDAPGINHVWKKEDSVGEVSKNSDFVDMQPIDDGDIPF